MYLYINTYKLISIFLYIVLQRKKGFKKINLLNYQLWLISFPEKKYSFKKDLLK